MKMIVFSHHFEKWFHFSHHFEKWFNFSIIYFSSFFPAILVDHFCKWLSITTPLDIFLTFSDHFCKWLVFHIPSIIQRYLTVISSEFLNKKPLCRRQNDLSSRMSTLDRVCNLFLERVLHMKYKILPPDRQVTNYFRCRVSHPNSTRPPPWRSYSSTSGVTFGKCWLDEPSARPKLSSTSRKWVSKIFNKIK